MYSESHTYAHFCRKLHGKVTTNYNCHESLPISIEYYHQAQTYHALRYLYSYIPPESFSEISNFDHILFIFRSFDYPPRHHVLSLKRYGIGWVHYVRASFGLPRHASYSRTATSRGFSWWEETWSKTDLSYVSGSHHWRLWNHQAYQQRGVRKSLLGQKVGTDILTYTCVENHQHYVHFFSGAVTKAPNEKSTP